jgi:hypothetical protein
VFGHHHHTHRLHARGHAHEVVRHQAHHREAAHGAPLQQPANAVARREVRQQEPHREAAWPLLYPIGPLSAMFQNILWGPPSSMWPMGYQTIFSSAFAQTPSEPDQCHQPVNANAIIDRLRQEIGPNTDQISRLQRLGRKSILGGNWSSVGSPLQAR